MESVRRCKLCGSPNLGDQNFKIIDDFIKQVLDVILLKLTLDDITQEVICEICFSKLSEAFDFKSTCVETEDIIFPYVNSERSKVTDLEEIYAMEKRLNQESQTVKDWVICRLCFQPVSSKIRDIQDVPLEIIQIYIPEVNFGVTTKALVCTKCFESLHVHSTFIKSCSAIEDKTNNLVEDIHLTNSVIKTEVIKIESVEEKTFCDILPNVVKKEETGEGNTSTHSLDGVRNTEDAESNVQSSVANHVKFKSSSESHVNDLSQVKTHNRDECGFETNYKNKLVQHQLGHKNQSEVGVFKSDKCTYESKFKSQLKEHQLIHKDSWEVQMFKCDKCEYLTKRKEDLEKHQAIHKDPSELRMHKCNMCTYKFPYKSRLLRHQRIHETRLKKMLECDKCEYVAKRKDYLAKHQAKHRDPSELRMHKCDMCTYKFPYKSRLLRHQRIHETRLKKMFECDKCEYVTKRKDYLAKHQLIHRDPEMARMNPSIRVTLRNIS